MDTPSQQLAAKIIDRLVGKKLFSADDGKKLFSKLAEGKLKAEDWGLAIELAGSKEGEK